MRFLCLIFLMLLAACGRPLTQSEEAFAEMIHGDTLDTSKVRLVNGAPTRAVTFRRTPRPRETCRERIFPPIENPNEIVTSKPAAVALYNHMLFDKDWYLDDFVPEYPDQIGLVAAMLLAHELTHVWQWQNRQRTGYTPLRAAFEHDGTDDPYLFNLDNEARFSDFGYEQQGSIMEEYICCRSLDPAAPRTARLHALIAAEMPVRPLPTSRAYAVGLPWKGVELNGICNGRASNDS